MDTNKTVILSFASKGREDYHKGLLRLMQSVRDNTDYDGMFWSLDNNTTEHAGFPVICCNGIYPQPKEFQIKSHQEVPYQFKLGCMQIARECGYKKIIWLDSSIQIVKNMDELFLKSPIIAFDNLGHPLKNYISDVTLYNMCVGSELEQMKQTWGGATGWDFGNKITENIFQALLHQSMIGSFNEGGSKRDGFIAHRHDQAVMSVLFNINNVPLLPYGTIVTAPHYKEPFEYGRDFYLIHKGV